MICCENIVDIAFFLIPSQISATIIYLFFLPFSVMALPQLSQIFFFPYFGNSIATIDFRSVGLGNRNFGNVITEIQNFLSPTLPIFKIFSHPLFLFLSHTFVEFRQHYCRNLLSFFNFLSNLKQYL